ncbi:MAG: hypothetical protein E7L01_01940 [Paenibacillus macerans]|uniref:hypothetical protein n=1 Tax=Paenibacillus TaxID=44249 RepID=UPI00290BF7F8|nr:hypothetical protein [Paenibacillus macerans]MDU7472111.1 hypothetical protein [Paenibacillus macerans]
MNTLQMPGERFFREMEEVVKNLYLNWLKGGYVYYIDYAEELGRTIILNCKDKVSWRYLYQKYITLDEWVEKEKIEDETGKVTPVICIITEIVNDHAYQEIVRINNIDDELIELANFDVEDAIIMGCLWCEEQLLKRVERMELCSFVYEEEVRP